MNAQLGKMLQLVQEQEDDGPGNPIYGAGAYAAVDSNFTFLEFGEVCRHLGSFSSKVSKLSSTWRSRPNSPATASPLRICVTPR